MAKGYNVGDQVKWQWSDGWGQGKVKERSMDKTTRTFKGTKISRDASDDKPACFIEKSDGQQIHMAHSEVQRAG